MSARQRARSRGFTLTELLISLVLGLFVVGGVLSVFLGGLETFRTTDSLSRIQESGRFALELMRRDLREAGYTGCRRTLRPELPRGTGPLDPGLVRNTLRPAPSGGADALAFAFSFGDAVMGYEATGDGTGTSWVAGDGTMPTVASNALITDALDDSDILIVVVARGAGVGVVSHPADTDPIVVEPGSGLAAGDHVFVTDCVSGAVMEVTGVSSTGGNDELAHVDAAGNPGNYTPALGRSFDTSGAEEVFAIERTAYYIADSPLTGRRSLFRNDQAIADNVEDLQVRYGVDTTADNRVDQYVTAAGMAGPPGFPWDDVVAVRVNLRISSGEENNITEQPVTLNYDGTTFTADADDLRLHQVFTATVGLRNRLP